MRRTTAALVAVLLSLLLGAAGTLPAEASAAVPAGASVTVDAPGRSAAASAGAVFSVGTAVRSIRPTGPAQRTHVGGFGDCLGCSASGGTTKVRRGDDLDVRVLWVSNGKRAVVRAVIPVEGMFAGYQEGPRLGLTDLRAEAAAALSTAALPMTQADLIINTNHCHACPTLIGVWGPNNVDYLRYVYDQTLAAILQARTAAAPATLRWATGDFGYANDITVGQANANEGWPIDGQLSVLQAKAVTTGRVIATYVEVPVHGNIVFGPDLEEMNSEHFGAAARFLEAEVGGTGIVAAGTLGDQTSPMQGDDTRLAGDPRRPYPRARPDNKVQSGYPRSYDVIDRLGALSANTALEALAHHGHAITDGTIASGESYQLVPATNPVVLALQYAHVLPGQPAIAGNFPIDRAVTPPYAAGNLIGVWFTVLRIGEVALASQPGEAFPHVSVAMRNTVPGAKAVFITANAQDQLGYYFEPWALPGTVYYSADHYLFNVGPTFAQQQINGTMLAARDAGFATAPTVSSLEDAAANDYLRYFSKAGVQTWVYPRGANDVPVAAGTKGIPVTIGTYFASARGGEIGFPGAEAATGDPQIAVDGKPVPYAGSFTPYTFPCAGDYTITATLPGTSASWKSVAHVRDARHVTNTAFYPSGTGPHPLADQNLDDGPGAPACLAVGTPSAGTPAGAGSRPALPATGLPLAVPVLALLLLVLGRTVRRQVRR